MLMTYIYLSNIVSLNRVESPLKIKATMYTTDPVIHERYSK